MEKAIKDYLEQFKIDNFLSADVIENFQKFHYAEGDRICGYNGKSDYLYFLVEGRAKVSITSINGKSLFLCFFEPLQLFGDLEMFEFDSEAVTAVEALKPSVCLALQQEYVLARLAADPQFLKLICLSLGHKINCLVKDSSSRILNSLGSRVAGYILETAKTNAENQLVFTGNLTRTADLLGTSYRHLLRTLQLFCDLGLLSKSKKTFTIKCRSELEKRAVG